MLPQAARTVVFALGLVAVVPAYSFDCAEKKCGQMQSCAEAYYHLSICGEGARDADNDGIPCENICGPTMDEYLQRRGPTLPGAGPLLQQFAPLPETGDSPVAPGAGAGAAFK